MQDKRRKIFGMILVFMGIMLVFQIYVIHFDIGEFIKALIPLGIIILGVYLMIRRKKKQDEQDEINNYYKQEVKPSYTTFDQTNSNQSAGSSTQYEQEAQSSKKEYTDNYSNQSTQSPKSDSSGKMKYDKVFGDMFIDLNGINAQNVEISMFIGDIDLNLRGVRLVDGLNRIVISSFVGGIKIFVPKGVAVFTHNSNFIGDIDALGKRSSGFGNNLEAQSPTYESSAQKLYIACNSFIGDIKIIEI